MTKPFWRSKKWWTAVIAASIPLANHAFGWGMDTEQVASVVLPLLGYVLGEAWADGKGAERPR